MSIQEQILELLITLKRTKDPNEKKKIKDKLKKLYNTFNRVSRKKVKFISPYKEEIKDIINPIKQSILTEKQKITLLKNTVKNEIQELKVLRDEAIDEGEIEQIEALIEGKKIEEKIVNDGVKNKENAVEIFEKVKQIKDLRNEKDLETLAPQLIRKYKNDPRTLNLQLSNAIKKIFGKDIDVKGAVRDLKQRAEEFVAEEDKKLEDERLEAEARAQLERDEAEQRAQEEQALLSFQLAQKAQRKQKAQQAQAQQAQAQQAQEAMEAKQPAPKKQGISKGFFTKTETGADIPKIVIEFIEIKLGEQKGDIDGREYKRLKKEYAKEVAQMTPEEQREIRKYTLRTRDDTIKELLNETRDVITANKSLPLDEYTDMIDRLKTEDDKGKWIDWEQLGQGKRKSKSNYMKKNIKGGAGIADWMMTLGSIPGVPQLMNNMGPFGQVLGNASGLAQSFGKTAGQLIKEQSKDGEKVAGFTDILGGPLKSMFGFGVAPPVIRKFETHLLKGGSLKDFWNKHKSKLLAIGIPTATMLGALASIKIGDKMIKDKNKALGIVERVKPDFFSRGTIEPTQDVFDEPQPFTEQAPLTHNWGGSVNMADVAGGMLSNQSLTGGAFLSDFLGTIGGITPKISGLVGAVPTYGKVATIGNSALGSFSRVGQDIAKMLGLGNMDLSGKSPRTKVGHGNMDLTGKTKGYGKKKLKGGFLPLLAMMGMGKKKGGRKMLPFGRPIPRYQEGTANILPYGLPEYPHNLEGGYGLTDMLIGATGDLIKSGVKGLANAGVSVAKDIAKKGVQELANKSINAIGKGRKKMRGCGKINGKYVSSEFEDNYENQVMKAMLMDKMSKIMAEQQMEGQIQQNMNMEQASALQQLQYYDMLSKLQQRE